MPVLERVAVSGIGRARLRALEANDPDEVEATARDDALLRRAGFTMRKLA